MKKLIFALIVIGAASCAPEQMVETGYLVTVEICAVSLIGTGIFFRWMEKREKKSNTKVKLKNNTNEKNR